MGILNLDSSPRGSIRPNALSQMHRSPCILCSPSSRLRGAARCLGLVGLLLCWGTWNTCQAQQPFSFDTQIQPLLDKHCKKCHGPTQSQGGLRLDNLAMIQRGGTSKKNLLATPVQSNELLRRVRSQLPGERMPLEGEPLSAAEIQLLTDWLATADSAATSTSRTSSWSDLSPLEWLGWWEETLDQTKYAWYFFLAVLAFFLLLERLKKWDRSGKLAGGGAWHQALRRLAAVPHWTCLVGVLVSIILGEALLLRAARHEVARLQPAPLTEFLASTPPLAVGNEGPLWRPPHPPRLGGIYYRGNDERRDGLFNGGYYRTATLYLSLRDEQGKQLVLGDTVTGPLRIRLEIERAPKTTPLLFREEFMRQIFVSSAKPAELPIAATVPYFPLQVVEKDQRWSVDFLLPGVTSSTGTSKSAGELFVYTSFQQKEGKISGAVHYVIGYDLQVTDGVLQPESQLWMGSQYNLKLRLPSSSEVTIDQWFDFRPIPEITGENSTDPKLLGVEE